jgi:hypothetical protein
MLGKQLEGNIGGACCPWRSPVGDHLAACWRWWRTYKRVFLFYVFFYFLFRKSGSVFLSLFYFHIFVFACKSSNREVGCNYKAKGVCTNVRGWKIMWVLYRRVCPWGLSHHEYCWFCLLIRKNLLCRSWSRSNLLNDLCLLFISIVVKDWA